MKETQYKEVETVEVKQSNIIDIKDIPHIKQKESAIPQTYLAVLEIITNSNEKFITRKSILTQLNKTNSYSRTLSTIIHNLIVIYNVPIGASSRKGSKGYFLIKSESDMRLALRDLDSRTQSMINRQNAIKNLSPNQED